MKKIEFKCNMCWDIFDRKDLYCMYWKSNILPQQYVLSVDVDKSDKHICKNCLKLIKETPLNV